MKRFLAFLTAMAALALVTTGCPGPDTPPTPDPDPDPDIISAEFSGATLQYYFAEEAGETDFFVLEFSSGEGFQPPYLDIEFTSDTFDEVLSAVPAQGTYTFSNNHAKSTFSYAEYYDDDEGFAATGGTFSIRRSGAAGYSIDINLELENGKVLKSTYEGDIYAFAGGKEDIDIEFDELEYCYTEAYEIPEHDGMWQFYFEAESDFGDEIELFLTINAESGLTEIPTGEFPMASGPRLGVAGTAEPSAWFRDDDSSDYTGCWYFNYAGDSGYGLYAIPDEGFVNIVEEDEGIYTIEFSFTIPTGKTVSGIYTGPVLSADGGEPYSWRAQSTAPWRPKIPQRSPSARNR